MPWKFWIDTGGTFTDCIAMDPDGNRTTAKILSSGRLKGRITSVENHTTLKGDFSWPVKKDVFKDYSLDIPSLGFKSIVREVNFDHHLIRVKDPLPDSSAQHDFTVYSNNEVPILAVRLLTHTSLNDPLPPIEMRLGTTKGTNALLESKGGNVTLLITKGFKDLMVIGNQQRPDLFALEVIKPPPLYHSIVEVDERLDHNGSIAKELTSDEIRSTLSQLKTHAPDAVAIGFFHSYKNPIHEKEMRKALQAHYNFISVSSELAPTIKIVPRAATAIMDAYLKPVLTNYLDRIRIKLKQLRVMSSSGGLLSANLFNPKDSLLSGPAGGLVGAVHKGVLAGDERMITFDMGGTSTDVSRYDGDFDYTKELTIGGYTIASPALAIHTIAAGGGSICQYDSNALKVGPESAGADPGPVCYGNGGPLTITDVNLLLGRLVPGNFSIPIDRKSADKCFRKLFNQINFEKEKPVSREQILMGFVQIANEKMADSIRKISVQKGYNPKDYTLITFGGAGGQHACSVAGLLGIAKIIIPYDAGLLSAFGLGRAHIERVIERQVLRTLPLPESWIEESLRDIRKQGIKELKEEGIEEEEIMIKGVNIIMRYLNQETTLEIPYSVGKDLREAFRIQYEKVYGHWIENQIIEIERIRMVLADKKPEIIKPEPAVSYQPEKEEYQESCIRNQWVKVPVFVWEQLAPGAEIAGPAIITNNNSSLFLEPEWKFYLDRANSATLKFISTEKVHMVTTSEVAQVELFSNRFTSIAEDMGALLQRTSFSVNVKERLDFSCALLDPEGYLVVNAPHIPVHLGSLGICVRSVIRNMDLKRGDVIITNHPSFGGSHLPDVSLMAPVYDNANNLIGYVANRAHHAEIGGKTPGSMPPDATSLEEEGVVIKPFYLMKEGNSFWDELEKIFKNARYPSRSINENMADLKGAVASLLLGIERLRVLTKEFGIGETLFYMSEIKRKAAKTLDNKLKSLGKKDFKSREKLDDGSVLAVHIFKEDKSWTFDFSGTTEVHPGNMNATPAIVHSVIMYTLRLIAGPGIPLNEGLMDLIQIKLPTSLLNPDFSKDQVPAVAGGNTETSQRLTDTLIKAFELSACSQGTMNNLVFGNEKYGYYETICGGTGAGPGFNGCDAVHHHMTNTRITDPEIIELRYPVQLVTFGIRENSGGKGKWSGGNGVTRKIRFLEPAIVSFLTQHRVEKPFGMKGGSSGKSGKQYIVFHDGSKKYLKGIDGIEVNNGDLLVVKTPGGGGWGKT